MYDIFCEVCMFRKGNQKEINKLNYRVWEDVSKYFSFLLATKPTFIL